MGGPFQSDFAAALWSRLRSVRLTIALFLLVAATAVLGTLVPQGLSPEEYVRLYGNVASSLLRILGLTDLYHSGWFIGLMALLVLNLVACSLYRLPGIWKALRAPQRPLTDALWRSLSIRRVMSVEQDLEHTYKTFRERLSRTRWSVREERRGEQIHLLAQKGRWGRLGVFVTHAGVVVILCGASVGSLFGFHGFVRVHEGETVGAAYDRRTGAARGFGFEVRCDLFRVSHYPDGTPMEFRSDLSFVEGERVVFQGALRVNHPIEHRGFVFYQSSYGSTVRVSLEAANSSGGGPRIIQTEVGETVSLAPGVGLQAVRYEEASGPGGPALLVAFGRPGQHPLVGWLTVGGPAQAFDGWTLKLKEASSRSWTGLQVKRDPGVWLVWVGCALVLAGCTLAFSMPYRALWVRLSRGHQGTLCHLAASAPKGRLGLERAVEGLCGSLAQRAGLGLAEGAKVDG